MTWYLDPMYSVVEVAFIILLAALPMSHIASVLLGVIESKTGIQVSQIKSDGND